MSIDMKQKGMQNREIAQYCGVCPDTITDWFQLFDAGGFEALCALQYEGRRKSRLEPYKEVIQKKEEEGQITSLHELKVWLSDEHQVQTCLSNLFYFCKKNSIFLTKRPD